VIALPDAAATARAGERLAALVRGGDAIALVGDLGAGKTTLVGGLARALGADATSPTFALVNRYDARIAIWHVDLYRIDKDSELVELGLEEIIGDPKAVALVEWADRFDVMPADHLRIALVHRGDARELEATGTGPRGRELAAELLASLP
jgi:tRNA threonylcarbamoyl adenosine modification protein YjeE